MIRTVPIISINSTTIQFNFFSTGTVLTLPLPAASIRWAMGRDLLPHPAWNRELQNTLKHSCSGNLAALHGRFWDDTGWSIYYLLSNAKNNTYYWNSWSHIWKNYGQVNDSLMIDQNNLWKGKWTIKKWTYQYASKRNETETNIL
jgi:hypothetical protein